jgi:ElaB/YqjD/DUF883 family membrane-anchored ribosome-binding protein
MAQITTPGGTAGDGFDIPPTDGLSSMARETIDRVAATANRAADEVRAAATKTVEAAKHTRAQAVAAGDASLRSVRSFAERNPLTTIGIAAAAGALLITLIRR